jgi:hypothetical protein
MNFSQKRLGKHNCTSKCSSANYVTSTRILDDHGTNNEYVNPFHHSEFSHTETEQDLVQTATLLKEANNYVESAARQNKSFLFVGTKRQATTLIAQEIWIFDVVEKATFQVDL